MRPLHSFRLLSILSITAVASIGINLVGCVHQNTHNDILNIPLSTVLTTDSQLTLQNIASQLPAKERALLQHYFIRIQQSPTQPQNAKPMTIGQAIKAQQLYEQQHPDDPMGIKATTTPQTPYSIALIPLPTPPALKQNINETPVTIKQPKFSVHLVNHSSQPLHTFTGTLVVSGTNFTQPQSISIPLTQFEPAIVSGNTGQLPINRSMENANILEDINDIQSVKIKISTGEITLTNGEHITIGK